MFDFFENQDIIISQFLSPIRIKFTLFKERGSETICQHQHY